MHRSITYLGLGFGALAASMLLKHFSTLDGRLFSTVALPLLAYGCYAYQKTYAAQRRVGLTFRRI